MAGGLHAVLATCAQASPRVRRVSAKNGEKPRGSLGRVRLKRDGKVQAVFRKNHSCGDAATRLSTPTLILYTQPCLSWTGCRPTIWTSCSESCLHRFAML